MPASKSSTRTSPHHTNFQNQGRRSLASRLSGAAMVVIVPLLLATAALGQGRTLYSFNGTSDGDAPTAGLVRDAAGNLYGTTRGGGDQQDQQCLTQIDGCGVVFEVTQSGGTWTETVIHTFVPGTDGTRPQGNLTIDSAGNLYGVAGYGGGTTCSCGTVYELSPVGDGTWTEKILYAFKGGSDGNYPEAGVIFDKAGNLYGTTAFGVNSGCNGLGCGMIFELSPGTGGTWTEKILYTFQDGGDGAEPGSALVFDKAGNLYGTAAIGGDVTCNPPYGCGTVYEISPSAGSWTEKALYIFECGQSGCFPNSGLAIDGAGNLYGNMIGGGTVGYGYVYKLAPQNGGTFQLSQIHSFDFTLGGAPEGTPLYASGILYGTASNGGVNGARCQGVCGGVYRLALSGLHFSFVSFGRASKGESPYGGLVMDPAGELYGTTIAGGAHGAGTVFEITP